MKKKKLDIFDVGIRRMINHWWQCFIWDSCMSSVLLNEGMNLKQKPDELSLHI